MLPFQVMSKKSTHQPIAVRSIAELQNLYGRFQKSCIRKEELTGLRISPGTICQVANLNKEEAVLPEYREGLQTES